MTNKETQVKHLCGTSSHLTVSDYLQLGTGIGSHILIVGEAPAPNGWRVSGRAFYTPAGKLLPTGVRLNRLLAPYNLQVENCAFTELVKCFVGGKRNLLRTCATNTWDTFEAQINFVDPSLILILGKATHKTLEQVLSQSLPFGQISKLTLGGKSRRFPSIFHPSPISPTSEIRNIEIFKQAHSELIRLVSPDF